MVPAGSLTAMDLQPLGRDLGYRRDMLSVTSPTPWTFAFAGAAFYQHTMYSVKK